MLVVEGIRQGMDVVTSCGTLIGIVDKVDSTAIRLRRFSAKPNSKPLWVPLDWVDSVNFSVDLKKDLPEFIREITSSYLRPVRERRQTDLKKRVAQNREKADRF